MQNKKVCPQCGHQGYRKTLLCQKCKPKINEIKQCPLCGNRSYRKRDYCHKCAPFNRKWTLKEDATILKVYPTEGADGVGLHLVSRTRNTIINRANKLGIKLTKDASHKFIHLKAAEYMRNHNPSKQPGASERLRNQGIELWKIKPYIPERLFRGHNKMQKANPTSLEKTLFSFLDKLAINYVPHKFIKPIYTVDAMVDNRIVIEVDGDWWHGHIRFEPLNNRQLKQQTRDKIKNKYLEGLGYRVYRIWESDLSIDGIKTILEEDELIIG